MSKLKSVLFLIFALSVGLFAQSPEKILKQAEKALGGAKKLQTIKSSQAKGTISRLRDGANGRYLTQNSQPNFYNETYDLDGLETETGYNGRSGWRRDSRDGLQTLTGNASRDLAVEADFHRTLWLDYKKDKAKISSGGAANINGKPAKIVVLTSAKGVPVKLYFDAATNLPVREEFPAGDTVKIYDFDDYRLVNSVKIPFSIQLKQGENVYQIKLDDVKINQSIAKSEFDFPQISNEPLPDIPKLLQDLQANSDKIDDILDTYSYNQKITQRELGKDGILRETESETNQLSFYKGYRISRRIEKNGKPLSEKDQKNEDEDVQKRVAEIEKKIAKAARNEDDNDDERSRRTSIAELLRASNLLNPRRERFRGRDVIVFDFEPNPNFDYKNAKSILKFFGKTTGVMWIDEKDKQMARVEAVLADSFNIGGGLVAKLKKGASFVLEQERVNDEIWLPSVADINLSIRVLLVKGVNINQVVKSYNYRKFSTEVKDASVDEIKKP